MNDVVHTESLPLDPAQVTAMEQIGEAMDNEPVHAEKLDKEEVIAEAFIQDDESTPTLN